jgi:hypothetical protein
MRLYVSFLVIIILLLLRSFVKVIT